MTIEPLDGLMRYHVYSDTPDREPYLVDLSEFAGNGKCDCPHFMIRLQGFIPIGKKRTEQQMDETRCKHIRAVREKLGKELLNTLVVEETKRESKARKT